MAGAVIRTISGEIDFSPYLREHAIPVNTTDQGSLIDIGLSFYSLPSYYEWIPGRELLGCEDIRLYVSGRDVTKFLKNEIKRLVGAISPDVIREAYLKGARSHINYVKGLEMYFGEMRDDEEFAERYASDQDWASKFDSLGSRKVGWMGNLHAVSFLFRFIPLPQISLSKVWEAFQASLKENQVSLSQLDPLVLTFSQGPAPSYESFDYQHFLPAGRLVYQLELSLKNPLEGPLRQIASVLSDLSMQLEVLRTKYIDPVTNEVQSISEDVKRNNETTVGGLKRLQQTVEQIKGTGNVEKRF